MADLVLGLVSRLLSDLVREAARLAFRRRRFSDTESMLLMTAAFLECHREGEGAEATLKLGNETVEDLEILEAYETLRREGLIVDGSQSRFLLSARGQREAERMWDQHVGVRHPA